MLFRPPAGLMFIPFRARACERRTESTDGKKNGHIIPLL